MICNVSIFGPAVKETSERPISSQTEPVCAYKLIITTNYLLKNTNNDDKIIMEQKIHDRGTVRADDKPALYRKEVMSKRRVKLKILCEYLHEKLSHCKSKDAYKYNGAVSSYCVMVTCNYEWLVSVIETEIDYHLGKRQCTKKYNEVYMREYTATQLSGFGEKFYHSENNISKSIISQMYQMNIKTKKV